MAVVGVVLVVALPWRSPAPPLPTSPPPPTDAVELRVLDDGVFVGSLAASTTIDIFNEPICPPCGSFIRSNAGDIDTAVNNKKLAVRYHLVNFLDDRSRSKNYSTRAVAATYCVAAQNDPKLYTASIPACSPATFSLRRTPRKIAPMANWPNWPKPSVSTPA